ncbi:hypothetical protein AHAS_Ahas08G0113500 [Arachis hypogaea]
METVLRIGALQALDYVIAEARQNGIRLLLSLVNNLQAYGGKTQYVKWAWEEGVGLSSSNDSFFFDPSIRSYFKNYVKTVLTRKNTITKIEYRNDPTIFGWELINEPRCMYDPSGDTLQEWLEEMSSFVKSIDKNHLLTIGHEGFYGPNDLKDSTVNPEYWASRLGIDFIRNSNISNIDFTSVHIYADHWFHDQSFEDQLKFVSKWMLSHIEDGDNVLNKPVVFSEYGYSEFNKNFSFSDREKMYRRITDIIYKSAKKNKSGAGALVWQYLVGGMNEFSDEYGMVPWESSSTHSLFIEQSCRLAKLKQLPQQYPNNLGEVLTAFEELDLFSTSPLFFSFGSDDLLDSSTTLFVTASPPFINLRRLLFVLADTESNTSFGTAFKSRLSATLGLNLNPNLLFLPLFILFVLFDQRCEPSALGCNRSGRRGRRIHSGPLGSAGERGLEVRWRALGLGPGVRERLELSAEPVDVAFDFALKVEALEGETAHGPVGLSGPRHEWVGDGDRGINAVVVELDVGVDARAGEACAVELAWAKGHYHLNLATE